MTSAVDNPYKNPEQEADRSNAMTVLAPNSRCTWHAVEGKTLSGDVVETRIASTEEEVNPAASQARCPAAAAKSEEACPGSAQCLLRIPVNAVI
jgi:hypothetical protein